MQELLNQVYGYLHGMWSYRWSALLVAWLVGLLGWFAVLALPDQYRTSAVVYIDTSSLLKPLLKGLAVETDKSTEMAVMTRTLLSRDNLLSVIRDTDLHMQEGVRYSTETLLKTLARDITIAEVKGYDRRPSPNLYEISYGNMSPRLTYQVVDKLLNTFIDMALKIGRTDTEMAQQFIDQQIADYEKRLTTAEQRLAQFKKENVGQMPDEKGGYYQRLQGAQDALAETGSKLNLARLRHAELERQIKGESPLLSSGAYGSEAAAIRLQQYQSRLAELLSQYTESHPDVQALRARIDDLQKNGGAAYADDTAMADKAKSVEFNPVYQDLKIQLSNASVEIQTLRSKYAEQQAKVDALKKAIDAIPEVEAELARLNRDYEVTRDRYLNLVERRESARMAQQVEQNTRQVTFRIIDPPVVPALPAGPDRVLFLTAVLGAALAAGFGWALLKYLLRPGYFNVDQLSESIGLPVLGSVSLYVSPGHRLKRRLQMSGFLAALSVLIGVYAGVLWKSQAGSTLIRSLLAQSGIVV